MEIKHVIESLNSHLEDIRKSLNINKKGHFVLQKTITPNNQFKAYKTYRYIVWYVQEGVKYKIITTQIQDKVIEGREEGIINKLNSELYRCLFDFISSTNYRSLVCGEEKDLLRIVEEDGYSN